MVFRDPMLRLFLLMPLLVLAVVVWLVPLLFAAYPAARDYDYVILMLAGMQTSTMFGFINGFVFLEEKDEQVFSALRVMPVSAGMLVGVRMLLGFAVACLVNVVLFRLTPWVAMKLGANGAVGGAVRPAGPLAGPAGGHFRAEQGGRTGPVQTL